jgi:23S rRNA-/tRNA-specific pseudouridylate synthase
LKSPKPQLRWVVEGQSGLRLGELLKQLRVADTRLASGGVLVNQRRIRDAEHWLCPNDHVEVFLEPTVSERCSVVEQRGDLLVVDKPASLASEPTRQASEGSVARELQELTGRPVHGLSRLDVGVSGLMLVSTSRDGNAHVERLRLRGQLQREYLALAGGRVLPAVGCWQSREQKGSKQVDAVTRYGTLESLRRSREPHDLTLLLLQPVTGRTHQLRIHCAAAGAALLGDRRYGGPCRLVLDNGSVAAPARILLHALRLKLLDMTGKPWHISSSHPVELAGWWQQSGGDPQLFENALRQPGSHFSNGSVS